MIDITSIILFFVIVNISIFVHELGHFLFAKLFGIKIESFNIGFGKVLFTKRIFTTDFNFRIILLGGYVKAGSFKSTLSKLVIVLLAGGIFNFLFGFVAMNTSVLMDQSKINVKQSILYTAYCEKYFFSSIFKKSEESKIVTPIGAYKFLKHERKKSFIHIGFFIMNLNNGLMIFNLLPLFVTDGFKILILIFLAIKAKIKKQNKVHID